MIGLLANRTLQPKYNLVTSILKPSNGVGVMQISGVVLYGHESQKHIELGVSEDILINTTHSTSVEKDVAKALKMVFGEDCLQSPHNDLSNLGDQSAGDITDENAFWMICELTGNDWEARILGQMSHLIRTRKHITSQPFLLEGGKFMINERQVFFDPTRVELNRLEAYYGGGLRQFAQTLASAQDMAFVMRATRNPHRPTEYLKEIRFIYRDSQTQVWYVVLSAFAQEFRRAFMPKMVYTSLQPQLPSYMALEF